MSLVSPSNATAGFGSNGSGELEKKGLEYMEAQAGRWSWGKSGRLKQLSGAYLAAHTQRELTRDFPDMYDPIFFDETILRNIIDHRRIDIRRALPSPVRILLAQVREALVREFPDLEGRDVRAAREFSDGIPLQQLQAMHDRYMQIVTRGRGDTYRLEQDYASLNSNTPESFPEAFDTLDLNADILPHMIGHPSSRSNVDYASWTLCDTLQKVRAALRQHSPEYLERERAWKEVGNQRGVRDTLWASNGIAQWLAE